MLTETEWQSQVVELAHLHGWNHLHVRRSIGGRSQGWRTTTNVRGWPDLFLWHPRWGFAAIELKARKNKPTAEQLAVLDQLDKAGAVTMVAWPDDLDELLTILNGSHAMTRTAQVLATIDNDTIQALVEADNQERILEELTEVVSATERKDRR